MGEAARAPRPDGDESPSLAMVMRAISLGLAVAIIGAELTLGYVDTVLGLSLHVVIAILALNSTLLGSSSSSHIFNVSLGIVSLFRIISLTMLVPGLDSLYSHLMSQAMILVPIVILLVRLKRSDHSQLSLFRTIPLDIGFTLIGLLLGIDAFLMLGPSSHDTMSSPGTAYVSALSIFMSSIVEEALFRGLILVTSVQLFGRLGIVISACIYAATYAGVGSGAILAFMVFVGLIFGFWVHRTGSLSAVVLARVALSIGLIVGPTLIGGL